MSVAVKILKTILILGLIVAVVLVFWFGIFGASAAVEVPIAEPSGLGLYPNDIKNEGWTAEFSLIDFINGTAYTWDEDIPVSFDGMFEADPDNAGREVYLETSSENKILDAINLMRLGSFNEAKVPYFGYYTDAGGGADIAGAIKGKLMSQTIHAQKGNDFFHQNINAIVQDPDFEMDPMMVTMAEGILNKAKRQLNVGENVYVLDGAFPKYQFGEDYVDAEGNVVLVNGEPTVFDDGRCTANWDAAIQKSTYKPQTPPSGLDAKIKFKLEHSNKFILSLNPSDYNTETKDASGKIKDFRECKPVTWFDATKTSIEKIYVDAEGNDATEATDNFYIRVIATADLPARPEDGKGIAEWAAECKKSKLNDALNMPNPNYIKDFNNEKLNNLEGYTGANPVHFTALKYTFEIWDCGLLKSWRTDEGWYGTLAILTGDVQPFNPTTYTYSKEYCNIQNFYELLKITDGNA